MGSKDYIDIMMNPTRQRIVQYLLLRQKGTPKEIQAELSDIPTASLYRHIKILYEGGCIEVLDEKKVRGTLEKTYGLVQHSLPENPSQEDMETLFKLPLMSLMMSFQKYFSNKSADPMKDMLSLSTVTIMLSDEEFALLFEKISNVYNEFITNEPAKGRKPRRLTFISSPCEE